MHNCSVLYKEQQHMGEIMVVGVILTVLLGTVTIGAVSEPSEPTPQVREYYGPGDYGND